MKTGLLLSGGMDSAAIAFWKRPDIAFTVDYGQVSAKGEIKASRIITNELQIAHEIISVDCKSLGFGQLVGKDQIELSPAPEWLAFRNQLLLTLTAIKAINLEVKILLFGSVKTDCFKDGSSEFFDKINSVFEMQEGSIKVEVPAITFSTCELIKKSSIPSSLLAWAFSCHVAEFPCGNCNGCNKNISVWEELGHKTY
jgi:7-cyano-7-deazaguanine synthase